MNFLVALLLVASPGDAYPSQGIANLRTTCMQRQDIPTQSRPAYCDCYLELMQRNIPWRDFLLLEAAIETKGLQGIDAEEKTILGKGLQATFYCAEKVQRPK